MSDMERDEDGRADAIAATAIISLIVFTLYMWLSGMPS
ncbi:MAG: methionine synthase [Halieaceae bacterium]|nr:methionine synthase [Halieaceae bacterium]